MNQSFLRTAAILGPSLLATVAFAQILYVPGGAVGNITGSNVGIGTMNPTSKVQIYDGTGVGTGLLVQAGYPFGAGVYPSVLKLKDKDSQFELFNVNSDGSFAFNRGPDRVLTGAANGNVGIGTTNPTAPLAVETGGGAGPLAIGNDSNTYLAIGPWRSAGGHDYRIGIDSSTMWFGAWNNFRWYRTQTGAVDMILASGNLGVGTNLPLRKLHLYEPNGYCEQLWEAGAVPAANIGRIWRWGTDPNGVFSATAFNSGLGSGVNALALTPAGKVGIGTTTPTYHLQIESALDNQFQVIGKGTGFGGALLASIYSERTTAAPSTDRLLQVGSAYSPNIFGVFGSGNVGIGTTNPTNKLEVNGTIRAKEVIVETTGWSDYVFAPDYRLAPLSEVEAHIAANGHLPGIPSAAEVATQGVSVGDMQAKLLAKMEEMTLHVIALSKKVDAQSAEIAALKSENATLKRNQP